MRPTARALPARLTAALWRALVGFGALWIQPPEPAPEPAFDVAAPRGVPPQHPERLCPEEPASPAERALWAQLAELDNWLDQ
ncbi:DUF6059 family protein [Kitasatospora sp. NPDC008050]|uniref:DUF6059 family protein n=1 Tax=Kitasatospora sp. NPDC008050 TaxID=3364021 RepID=UPI0036EA7E44